MFDPTRPDPFDVVAWHFDPNATPACCFDTTARWHFDLAAVTSGTTTTRGTTNDAADGAPRCTVVERRPAGGGNTSGSTTGSTGGSSDGDSTGGTTGATTTTGSSTTAASSGNRASASATCPHVTSGGRARAGRPFALQIRAGSPVGRMSCSAKLGSRPLAATVRNAGGMAVCAICLPVTSHGRVLQVAITASVGAKRLTASYRTHVA